MTDKPTRRQIVDSSGHTIPRKRGLFDWLRGASTRTRLMAVTLVAFVAGLAALAANIKSLKNTFWPAKPGVGIYGPIEVALIEYFRQNGVPNAFDIVDNRIVFRDTRDDDIVFYLDEIAKQAELIADIWMRAHQQLVDAATEDETEWRRLSQRVLLRPPPNVEEFEAYFAWLSHFDHAVAKVTNDRDGVRISRFISHSEQLLESRGRAVTSLMDLVNEEYATIDDRNEKLKELGKIVQSLVREAAALKVLATSVRHRLAARLSTNHLTRALQPTCYPCDYSTVNENGKLFDGLSRHGKARTRLN